MKTSYSICLMLMFLHLTMQAQTLSLPPSGDNQKSSVTQYIGSLVQVSVDYSSPDITGPNGEDRTGAIWGQLVPYGMTNLGFGNGNPGPWRAGANENTVITFSHDVLVQGKPLPAGTYGLHLIVRETGPWTWIFSHNTDQWGSYFYDESEDALRVDAEPNAVDFHEWLTYEFVDRKPQEATLALAWEYKSVPMRIQVPDYDQHYVDQFKRELQGSAGFDYRNFVNASQFCVTRDVALDQALLWADAAISAPFIGVENFNTLQNKAIVLMKLDRSEEGAAIVRQVMMHPTANAFLIHSLGRQLIQLQAPELAMDVFRHNHDQANGAWPTNVGMARGLSALGQYEEALKYAELAHAEAPDQVNKQALATALEQLRQGQDIN